MMESEMTRTERRDAKFRALTACALRTFEQSGYVEFNTTYPCTSESRVIRADICVMVDVPVVDFVLLDTRNHFVSKLRNVEFELTGRRTSRGKNFVCYKLGSRSSVELYFYDKRREVEKAIRDHEEIDFDSEWFESGKAMTCIEFRLFRAALNVFGVKTEHDLRCRAEAIIDILTHDWFRILKMPKVRGCENKAAIHPLWERIRKLMIAGKGNLCLNEQISCKK